MMIITAKKAIYWLVLFLLGAIVPLSAQHIYPPQPQWWNADSLGNQRAVLQVKAKGQWAHALIYWRNRKVADDQQLLVVDSASNALIDQVHIVATNKEFGELFFEPLSGPGIYYVYYLPYKLGGRSRSYPDAAYLKRKMSSTANKAAFTRVKNEAAVERFESVDAFNNNDPMEVMATEKEVSDFINSHTHRRYFVFPELADYPIKMRKHLPLKWIAKKELSQQLSLQSDRGRYYAFQLGVWANALGLQGVQIEFGNLTGPKGELLNATFFDCLNTNGIGYDGKSFTKEVNVEKSTVQSFWCGVQIPADIIPGLYKGTLRVKPKNAPATDIKISLRIHAEIAKEQDVDKPWAFTRLPWLNSTLAQENSVIKPYTSLQSSGDTAIQLLGRKVILARTGFPKQIQTFFTPEMTAIGEEANDLLTEPIHFHVQKQTDKKDVVFRESGIQFSEKSPGTVKWQSVNIADDIKMEVSASLEFDGFLSYQVKFTALKDISLWDIAMHIPYRPEEAAYLMGLGLKGGKRPPNVSWKWDVARKNQDGAWMGNVNAGMQFSLRDERYVRPLNTNFYLQKPLLLPASWGNGTKGGIEIGEKGPSVLVNSYSGSRTMKKGDTLYYNFNLLITPFHPLNTQEQWQERYFHAYQPVDSVKASGATVINIHHGNRLNPYINYPFIATEEMKAYVDSAHRLGLKVKIYNTIREVSNRMYELYPVRSLGNEVFSPGAGKGYSWLQEHLHDDYIAAWYVPKFKDAAIINSGMNRWHNYYVEGMNWLVDHVGIDGIYLDDVAFDRVTMKRIKRVMTKEGHPGIIDLHSANQYNERDGFNNSANLYLEHFPYLNRLWFGEYFDYENNSPDFFLTEVSGIPFGLMGEMLQGGGNPWRGMLYGMTNRLPYQKTGPQGLWKIWDTFGMEEAKMIGYWVKNQAVKTDRQDVLTTLYVKDHQVMVALASWAKEDVPIHLEIDWKALGINPKAAQIVAPEIKDFQQAKIFKPDESILVSKNKGWLFIIK